jgi:hypothetical protein
MQPELPIPLIPFKFVTISWFDAYSDDGWSAHDSADVRAEHPVLTTGWIVHETERYVVVAGTVAPDPEKPGNWQISGAMGIPKGCILHRLEPSRV